jgi:hypothetical protein
MDGIPLKVFDIGEPVEHTAIEAQGHRWLVYWLLGPETERCYMTDGRRYVEIANPHEWQALHMEAGQVNADEVGACDLACERLAHLMQKRQHWRELE